MNILNSKSHYDIKEEPRHLTINRSVSDYVVKHLRLGKLDPELYKTEEFEDLYELSLDHVGRVWFTLQYECIKECLVVEVHKVRNLKLPNNNDYQSVTVKVYLQNHERHCHYTSLKARGTNIDFNEKIMFQIPQPGLTNHTLCLMVLMSDKSKQPRPLSICYYKLRELLIPSSNTPDSSAIDAGDLAIPLHHQHHHSHKSSASSSLSSECSIVKSRIYRDLREHSSDQYSGCPEICVSMKHYSDTNRLNFIIYKVKNVPAYDKGVYIKLKLLKGLTGKDKQTRQTSIVKGKHVFNESFTFFKIFSLEFITIRITLMSQKTLFGVYDKPLGSVTVGSKLFTKGVELSYWTQMIDQPEDHNICWIPLHN